MDLSGELWPAHPKPLPDELLSSWLMRTAHANGLRLQTFCNLIFGGRRQVWNRDIDRLGPTWLISTMATCTGTPWTIAYGTTLRTFEGVLFRRFRPAGTLQWIQTLLMYHRKRQGYGLQVCPRCLREGEQPYYRRIWRVSFNTVCPLHQRMLLDRCPACGAGVAFHRTDIGRDQLHDMPRLMLACHRCGIDLSTCDSPALHGYDAAALQAHVDLCQALQSGHNLDRGRLDVMHHLGGLMQASTDRLKLQAFAAQRLNAPTFPRSAKRISIESRELEERHHYMLLINWLMDDLESRLNQAREAKALRYLHMKRDFEDPPPWYGALVARFERRASAVVTLRSLPRQTNPL
jgi:hypothetical protein